MSQTIYPSARCNIQQHLENSTTPLISSTLIMESAWSCETSVQLHQVTRRHKQRAFFFI